MSCKTDKIRSVWAAGDRIGALRIAAGFFDRSAATKTFKRGMDTLLGWDARIPLRHSLLLLDRAPNGVHRTAKLKQNSVAGALNNAAPAFCDRRLQEFEPVSIEPGECGFLVNAHEPTVAGDIPRQNCRKPPLHTLFSHRAMAPIPPLSYHEE